MGELVLQLRRVVAITVLVDPHDGNWLYAALARGDKAVRLVSATDESLDGIVARIDSSEVQFVKREAG